VKKVVREGFEKVFCEEGFLQRRRFVKEEGCLTGTINKLVDEGGKWRRTNKFVKKVVREEEGCSRKRRQLVRKKAICEEEGNLRGRRLFDKYD
jgi:hypothetical protein